jgi:hypothetical protein
MSVVQRRNDVDMGRPKYSNRIKCHFVEHITQHRLGWDRNLPFPVAVLAISTSVSSTVLSDKYHSETCL